MKKHEPGSPAELLNLAYPLILSTASATVMQFVNRVFLSRYSADAIAACVPAGILSFCFACFFLGTAAYTNAFVAQYHGNRKPSKVTLALWQGVWLSFGAWLLLIALTPLGLWFIKSSGHDPAVKILEAQYFTILNAGGGLLALNAALSSFFTGRSLTKVTMMVNTGGNLLNILLSWLLIFGAGPFPELGIRGAGYAYVAGQAAMAFTYFSLILSGQTRKKYRTLELISFSKPLFLRLIKYGAPNGVGFLLDVASFTVFFFMIGNLDKVSLAANNIIASINSLAFMPVIGLGMATLTLVGQYVGAKKHDTAQKVAHSAMQLAFGYVLILAFIFVLFPHQLVDIFGMPGAEDFTAILDKSRPLMKILAVFILFDGIGIVCGDAIRGAGDTRFQMASSLLCAWVVFMPGAYFLIQVKHASLAAVWSWAVFYVIVLAVVFWLRLRSGKWRAIDILRR